MPKTTTNINNITIEMVIISPKTKLSVRFEVICSTLNEGSVGFGGEWLS